MIVISHQRLQRYVSSPQVAYLALPSVITLGKALRFVLQEGVNYMFIRLAGGPKVECNVISNEFCVTLGCINGRTSADYKCPGVGLNLMMQK